MKLQTTLRSESIEDPKTYLKEHEPEKYSLLENWEELDFKFDLQKLDEGEYILFLEVEDSQFEQLTNIFSSKEEAMGAFLTTAQELGWEEVPSSYIVYHADFDGDKVIAGVKSEEGISVHDQLHLEDMIKKMIRYPRVVVYSSDVITYIKDLFPDIDHRAYVISREIAKVTGKAPDLKDIGRIYGVDTSTLEGKLELIEKLLTNPVKLPEGEVNLRPYYYPL